LEKYAEYYKIKNEIKKIMKNENTFQSSVDQYVERVPNAWHVKTSPGLPRSYKS
jgi:hypothetical protein